MRLDTREFRRPSQAYAHRILAGLMTDNIGYSIIIPTMPFHLERLSYHNVSSRLGWLLFAYVCRLSLQSDSN